MSLLDRVVNQSSITPRQLESLSSYLRVVTGELGLKEAASVVSGGRTRGETGKPVTVGSYYRTVHQARTNVKKALMTVVVALWAGAIRVEDVRRLFDLVGGGARDLPEEEAERLQRLLDALLQHMIV